TSLLAGTLVAVQLATAQTAHTAAAAAPPKDYAPADVAFMSGMIYHHTQARLMAGWAPSHGAGADVRTLCERIINAQKDEIRIMGTWLRGLQPRAPRSAPPPTL